MNPVSPRRACLYADHATVVRFVSNYSPQLCWGAFFYCARTCFKALMDMTRCSSIPKRLVAIPKQWG